MKAQTEKDWQTEDDARSLKRVAELVKDKNRYAAALKFLKKEAENAEVAVKQAQGLRSKK